MKAKATKQNKEYYRTSNKGTTFSITLRCYSMTTHQVNYAIVATYLSRSRAYGLLRQIYNEYNGRLTSMARWVDNGTVIVTDTDHNDNDTRQILYKITEVTTLDSCPIKILDLLTNHRDKGRERIIKAYKEGYQDGINNTYDDYYIYDTSVTKEELQAYDTGQAEAGGDITDRIHTPHFAL